MDRGVGIIVIVITLVALYLYSKGAFKSKTTITSTPGTGPLPPAGVPTGPLPGMHLLDDPLLFASLFSRNDTPSQGVTVNVGQPGPATGTDGAGSPNAYGQGFLPWGAAVQQRTDPATVLKGGIATGGINLVNNSLNNLQKCHGVLDCAGKGLVAGGLTFGLLSLL